jgi:hypothetical protein
MVSSNADALHPHAINDFAEVPFRFDDMRDRLR